MMRRLPKISDWRFLKLTWKVFQRFPKLPQNLPMISYVVLKCPKYSWSWPKAFQRFLKLMWRFPKISEVDMKSSMEFWSWPDDFQRFMKLTRSRSKTSEVDTKFSEDHLKTSKVDPRTSDGEYRIYETYLFWAVMNLLKFMTINDCEISLEMFPYRLLNITAPFATESCMWVVKSFFPPIALLRIRGVKLTRQNLDYFVVVRI